MILIYILSQREPRLDALIQSEDKAGNGVYLPTLDDPELCNPFATSLYELFLYQVGYNSGRCFPSIQTQTKHPLYKQNHYDPNIRALAKSLAAFQPVAKIVKA